MNKRSAALGFLMFGIICLGIANILHIIRKVAEDTPQVTMEPATGKGIVVDYSSVWKTVTIEISESTEPSMVGSTVDVDVAPVGIACDRVRNIGKEVTFKIYRWKSGDKQINQVSPADLFVQLCKRG